MDRAAVRTVGLELGAVEFREQLRDFALLKCASGPHRAMTRQRLEGILERGLPMIAKTLRARAFDHFAFEVNSWNDIRDWADHMAARGVKLWWGPGRHGPGNNLFFMIKDPQGYLVEISAELEIVPDTVEKRSWPHEERTLNLWGPGFMRS
jgi:catechol 2,3-dioxygenase-like lactoylglutathione lyase family enzyme